MPVLGSIIKTAIELRNKWPQKTRRYNPLKAQKRTLRRLLRRAQLTSFGEKYEFSNMLLHKDFLKAFQERVPIHDYETIFNKWWYRTLNGEPYVCWPNVVRYFALSSGTSGASSKYIPVTGDMLHAIKKTSIRQIISMAKYDFPNEFFQKGILMLGGSTRLQYNGTYYAGDLSGITAGNIPFWFQHFYKPGRRISKERDWSTKRDEIVKNASNWDIGVICGVPAWIQILLEKIIDHYKLDTIHDIWPNLSIFVHGGVSFAPYKNSFEKLLARPITYIETYLASEGFIAYQSRPESQAMEMVFGNGIFYEFIPFNDNNFDSEGNMIANPKTLTIDQIEENTEYALLLSTCAGAWRYLIGDTIKFVSKKRNEIIITGRTKLYMSLCGEHLSLENMTNAIKMLEDEFRLDIREFALAGVIYDTMFAHKWYIGMDMSFDSGLAAEKLDEYLKILNDDYRVERIAAIKKVEVEILPPEIFYTWMKKQGKEGAQNKFPRVLKNNKLENWENFIAEYRIKM